MYTQSRQTRVDTEDRPTVKYVSLPSEEIGLAMVYSVGEHVSSAIILEATSNISVGNILAEPGRDLDNMSNDTRHVPNTPQGPYNYEDNQFDFRSNIDPNR